MYVYPYGDSQQLNLDWIINKLKELEDREVSAADLEEIANVFIALTHSSGTQYRRYDYCYYQGKLYRALNDNIGAFNASDWMEVRLGDDIPVLTRLINAIDAAAVVDVKFDTSGTNGKLQQKYNNNYHDVVEVDYAPVQNSKRPLSSNAGYELNGAINANQSNIAPVETGTTASREYFIGDFVIVGSQLYTVIAKINNGNTFTVGTNITAKSVGEKIAVPKLLYSTPTLYNNSTNVSVPNISKYKVFVASISTQYTSGCAVGTNYGTSIRFFATVATSATTVDTYVFKLNLSGDTITSVDVYGTSPSNMGLMDLYGIV